MMVGTKKNRSCSRNTAHSFLLSASFLLVALLLCSLADSVAAAEQQPPNIILLLTDDQRWDALGAAGNQTIHTPHLDALAQQGVRFTNCFCTTSICCTSRATILSGQYARRHQIWGFRTPFSAEAFAETFPAQVRKAGYQTAFVGKWGIGGQAPADQYDFWAGFSGQGRYYENDDPKNDEHLTRKITRQTLEFLDQRTDGKPFCLQVSYKAPHCQDGHDPQFPYDTLLKNLYADDHITPPATATPEHFARLPAFLQNSEARRRWGLRFDGDENFQQSVKAYYRLISGIDVSVGKIVQQLRDKGLDKNTVIIFTSDNGYYLGDHGLAGKWFMHEPSIRLPLIVYDPRLPNSRRGATSDEMVLTVDLAPTILAVAEVEIPTAMQGRNMLPLVQGDANTKWRSEFLYEHLFNHASIAQTEGVRTKRWKYTRYSSVQPVYEELFDLKTDPQEETNLATMAAHQEKLLELRVAWQRLVKENQ